MASNHTEHYNLCQWEATDQVLRTDFNEDNAKVDAALNALAAQDTALNELVNQRGNCQLYTTSYTGTGSAGESDPNSVTFPQKPVFVMISGRGVSGLITHPIDYMICIQSGGSEYCRASWSTDGKTLSWYTPGTFPRPQLNELNEVYQVSAWIIT